MAYAPRCLVDTNILLRVTGQNDPHHLVGASLKELKRQGTELYFCLQNIAEFWNVCTRPTTRNGFDLSISETSQRVESIERTMTFLPDNELVYSIWRRLVAANSVRGVQVHDARLAAIMQAYGINHILTLNVPDFVRYTNLQTIHPGHLKA